MFEKHTRIRMDKVNVSVSRWLDRYHFLQTHLKNNQPGRVKKCRIIDESDEELLY